MRSALGILVIEADGTARAKIAFEVAALARMAPGARGTVAAREAIRAAAASSPTAIDTVVVPHNR